MIRQFEKLSLDEKNQLYLAPVLVSILAAGSFNDKEINKSQKADAIKLAHLKTFTAAPVLLPYYAEVEKGFNQSLEIAIKKYFPFNESAIAELKIELDKISLILNKLDVEYAETLRKSLEKYALHVRHASHSVFQDFIFPLPIRGLSC